MNRKLNRISPSKGHSRRQSSEGPREEIRNEDRQEGPGRLQKNQQR